MRDITADLEERLAKGAADEADEESRYEQEHQIALARHRRILDRIHKERLALKQMLEIERQRSTSEPLPPELERPPLLDFLISTVEVRGSMTKDDLRSAVDSAGYGIDGRTIHVTLMNIVRSGKIALDEAGNYSAKASQPALFGDEKEKGDDMQIMN